MEDYKKKLKEALDSKSTPFEVQAWIEEHFPSLIESEDERIRKSIIELLNEVHFTFKHYDINKMLAWLEKQETENIILENRIVQLQEKLRDFGCEL